MLRCGAAARNPPAAAEGHCERSWVPSQIISNQTIRRSKDGTYLHVLEDEAVARAVHGLEASGVVVSCVAPSVTLPNRDIRGGNDGTWPC